MYNVTFSHSWVFLRYNCTLVPIRTLTHLMSLVLIKIGFNQLLNTLFFNHATLLLFKILCLKQPGNSKTSKRLRIHITTLSRGGGASR